MRQSTQKFITRALSFVLVVVTFTLLHGCGGGGGGGGGGTKDAAFTLRNQGLGMQVNTIVRAVDGSGDIYVGGSFASYNSTPSSGIIRFNSDGTVDTGFAVGQGFDGSVNTIVPVPDGSGDIYVSGTFFSYNGTASGFIIRLNSDGSVDDSFSVVGSGFNLYVYTIALATDGSGDIYVGGVFSSYNGTTSKGIIRLNSDGTADTDFVVGSGFSNTVTAIVAATDGSGDIYVLVSFGFPTYKGAAIHRIVRLDNNGTLDAGFAVGSGFDSSVNTIALAADGSGDIYVGGSGVVRLNSDGSVDNGFTIDYGSSGTVSALSLAADDSGDIYVGAGSNSYKLFRFNSDGSVDSGFVAGELDNKVITIMPTADASGDIYVGGNFGRYNGTISSNLIRLSGAGFTRKTYSANAGFDGYVNVMALAADQSGDIYVGGWFENYNGNASRSIIRLNNDGSVDKAFSVGAGFSSEVNTIIPATDGSGDIYVGGSFAEYNETASNYIVRLNNNGSIDTAFEVGNGFNNRVNTIVLATDGSGDIYVGGYFGKYNDVDCPHIVRLNSDGSVDTAFVVGSGFNDEVNIIVPSADGSGNIYVGGRFATYKGADSRSIIRLKSDGSVDSTFAVGTGFTQQVSAIAEAKDGSGDVYIGGYFDNYNGPVSKGIVRLNHDGSVDSGFVAGSGFDGSVSALALAADGTGDIYAGGRFSSYNSTASSSIIRLNSDGSIDSSFAVGAGFVSFSRDAGAILPSDDASGDIYVGGKFASYQNTTASGIISLNPDGSID